MGRIIDRISLTALGCAAFYLVFLNAGFSIPMSCALAFAAMCLLRHLIRHRPRRFRWSSDQAAAAVSAIAKMPEEEAFAALQALLGAKYPPSMYPMLPVIRHPDSTLSADDIFSAWKAHRECGQLVIAATCSAGPDALSCAAGLSAPAVAIAGKKTLVQIIRRTGQFVPPDAPRTSLARRVRRASSVILARRAGPKALLYGLSLLMLYLALGKPAYLFASLLLLFHFGSSRIRHSARI